jgi:hypothetical protein
MQLAESLPVSTKIPFSYLFSSYLRLCKKVKQSLYRPGVAQRVPGS